MYFCTMRKYLILILILYVNLIAQTIRPKEYVISHWGLDEGLPQSTVNDVLQTHDGYIWLATYGGLVRFDGNEFTVYNRSNSPGMLSDRTILLFQDRSGKLWIGTEGGLVCYTGNSFKTFTITDGLKDNLITKIMQDSSGTIWVFTANDFIHKYVKGHFIPQHVTEDESLKKLALNLIFTIINKLHFLWIYGLS